jgi:hypothetical protein
MTTTTTTPPADGAVAGVVYPRPFRAIQRYAMGFKWCSSCEKWTAPNDVIYKNEEEAAKKWHPRCPHCGQLLKTRPRSAAAKRRLAQLTGVEVKRY